MKKIYFSVIVCLLCLQAEAQIAITDTLKLAQQLSQEQKLVEANNLLTTYNLSNPSHYGFQLQGQVQYWLKDFTTAEATYQKGLQLFPSAYALQLDYGQMLFELGKYKKATLQLRAVNKNAYNEEASLMLAKMELYNSQYTASKERVRLLLKSDPENQEAKAVLLMARQASSPVIRLESAYSSDDQPLNVFNYSATGEWTKSKLLSPTLSFQQNNFTMEDGSAQTNWLNLENTFRIGYGKTIIKAAAGLFQNQVGHRFLGSLSLDRKLGNSLSLQASLVESPYLHTLASITKPVFQQSSSIGLTLNKADKWLGRVSYLVQGFEDGNQVYTAYAWFLAPVIFTSSFTFHTGISSSYANSKFNTFSSPEPVNTLSRRQPWYTQVAGIYDPYFTPKDQFINALLAATRIDLSKNTSFYARGSAGLFSKASNPYLMIEQNKDELFISKNYFEQRFLPLELEAKISTAIGEKMAISGIYQYQSLFFYQRKAAQLQLNYRFIHD